MTLQTLVTQYTSYRKSLGEAFISNESNLKAFVRYIGQDKNFEDVQTKQVNMFLTGNRRITASWFNKYQALR